MGMVIPAANSANKLRAALAAAGNAYRAADTPTPQGRAGAEQTASARKAHRPASDCLGVAFLLAPIVLALVFPLSLVMGLPFAAISVLCVVIALWRGIPLDRW
jgi:hypothetical protein